MSPLRRELEERLLKAWGRVLPRLQDDPDELQRRLARRRQSLLTRPLRVHCIAVRACDRRITPYTFLFQPTYAADPRMEKELGRYPAHRVTLTADNFRELVQPLEMGWREHTVRQAAAKLGRHPNALLRAIRKGTLHCDRIFGLLGARWKVPLVWSDDTLDPCHGNLGATHDIEWGLSWTWLGDLVPKDFSQTLFREPVYRTGRFGRALFRGWRWICPGCKRRVAIVYFPLRTMTLGEFYGDEQRLVPDPEDALPRPPTAMACHRCHQIRNWSRLHHNSWNHYVAYCSGGLLYGGEVEKPPWWKGQRKRRYARHGAARPVGVKVEAMLGRGLSYRQIAQELGRTIYAVQNHIRRIYPRWGVHNRREFIRRYQAGEKAPAEPA